MFFLLNTNGVRLDRIAFFAEGDFQSTGQYRVGVKEKTIVGNTAAIFYGQTVHPDPNSTDLATIRKKILARRQTIIPIDPNLNLPDQDKLKPPREYYEKSLSVWNAEIVARKPEADVNNIAERPTYDPAARPADMNDLSVMYLAKGVHNFAIQYAEWDPRKKMYVWKPTYDDLKNHSSDWQKKRTFSTEALKFTFTLYDSRGILKNGRTFTHIVYLE